MTQHTEGHLGGYVIGGDEATWYPALWQWFIDELDVRSVLDLGCGEGHSTEWFVEHGCSAIGVDGIYNPLNFRVPVLQHDYATGPLTMKTRYDLAWCCEFVEHVEERYVANFVESLKAATIVAMTHAAPGQAGHHHVNCRDAEYWRGVMAGAGFVEDQWLTMTTRHLARENPSPWNHYARSGMVFVQEGGA